MLFNSYIFILFFLPFSLVTFYFFAKLRPRLSILWLCLLSFIFYGFNDHKLVLLLLGSIISNYSLSRLICSLRQRNIRIGLLITSISLNLFSLFIFKYYNFFLDTYSLFTDFSFTRLDIVLPLGISFFTFTQIAYLVDSYSGFITTHDFFQYALFVSFFPQLVAGPILHFRQLAPQFSQDRFFSLSTKNISLGLTLFVIGLSKKVLIADNLSIFSDALFDSHSVSSLQFFEAWAGTLSFTFQLYFDFSGYSDMAIGIAKCFNLDLPINFNSPYRALSVIDFWRRWHITLSNFLRDYIYIPLGGNRVVKIRKYFNLVFTMLIGGLWHGASFTFIVWGFLHGIFLAFQHSLNSLYSSYSIPRAPKIVSIFLTFFFINITWVFFRSDSVLSALHITKSLLLFNGVSLPHFLLPFSPYFLYDFTFNGFFPVTSLSGSKLLPILIVSFFIVFFTPNSYSLVFDPKPSSIFNILCLSSNSSGVSCWSLSWRSYIFTSILLFISFLCISKASPYLYYQF